MSLLPRYTAAAAGPQLQGRVLTRDEGLAVVEAISEHRTTLRRRGAKLDCSHLVNDVYNLAGFPYLYAKSSDLYRGHPSFTRVKSPQPGDLIVWRGHVGLVTDPREHLFYSSLRSGLDIEDYTSAYWTKHGTPRFYRYRITNDEPSLFAHGATSERSTDASFRTLPARQSTRDEVSEESLIAESPETVRGPSGNPVGSREFAPAGVRPSGPIEILVTGGRDKPTIEQVSEAVSRMNQSLSKTIEAESLLRSPSTIVIFTELQVKRLQFKGNRGWAYINVDSSAYINEGELDKTSRHGEEHWEMTRSKSGWKVLVPAGNIYVPRSAAARIFAQQLARLTEKREVDFSNSVTSEESKLASILNSLLKN